MGGFGGVAYHAIEEAAGHLAPEMEKGIVNAADHFFSLDSTMTGKSGAAIKDMIHNVFIPELDKSMSAHVKSVQSGVPLPGKSEVITDPIQMRISARNAAADTTFGKKRQNLAFALAAMKQEHGALGPIKAANAADHVAIFLHEQANGVPGKVTSETAGHLARYKEMRDVPLKVSSYQRPEDLERKIASVTSGALATKAAIPHTIMGMANPIVNARATSILKAIGEIAGHGFAPAKFQLIAMDAFGHGMLDEYSQMYNFRGGVISKFAPGSIGKFIHENYMIPGLSFAKNRTMIFNGMVGKYEAKQAAWALTNGFEKRGASSLANLGINWKDVAPNGKLTDDQISMAMRQTIQKNMFIEQGASKTKLGTATPLGRLLTLFHTFGNMEAKLIFESSKRNLGQMHDPGMFLQQLVALGVVFPMAGNAIYSIEQAALGHDDHPIDSFTQREKTMLGADGAAEGFAETISAISHMAGFGVVGNLTRAAAKEKLANAMVGPTLNAVTELGSDAWKATKSDEDHPHAADQFKRDLLHDIPSIGIGAWAAGHFYPTRAERDAEKVKTPSELRRERHKNRRRRKK
jgi:hypothetical protein